MLSLQVCLDRYNQPRILPCQHTFCRVPCLQGLVDRRTHSLSCPECRAEHRVPYNGPDGFPPNLIISNFLDLQPQLATVVAAASNEPQEGDSSTRKCGICEKEAETTKCVHCDKLLCPTCHKSHMTQMKFDIGRLINQIRRGMPKLSESITRMEHRSERVKQHVETVKSDVRDTMERYIKQMKDREKLLNSELETFLQGEQRSLRIQQENAEVELASISSYCDSAEGLLNRAGNDLPDTELWNLKKQCSEYMEQIRNTDSNVEMDSKVVKFECDGQELHSNVSSFGSLVVTTPRTGGSQGSSSTGASETRHTRNNDRNPTNTRQRWSTPQPLHELYTREATTSSPTNSPDRTMSPIQQNLPRIDRRVGSEGVANRNFLTHEPASTTLYDIRRSPPNSLGPSRMPTQENRYGDYMFRMSTSHDNMMDTIERFRRMEAEILSIPPRVSPRPSQTSSIFGTYSPSLRQEEERTPGLFGGGGGGGIPVQPVRAIDRRPAVAFSVDIDEDGDTQNHRRPRWNRGRNLNTNTNRNSRNTRNARGRGGGNTSNTNSRRREGNIINTNNGGRADTSTASTNGVNLGEVNSPNMNTNTTSNERNPGIVSRIQDGSSGSSGSSPQASTSGQQTSGSSGASVQDRRFQLTRSRTFTMDDVNLTNNTNTNNNNNATTAADGTNVVRDGENGIEPILPGDISSSDSLTVTRSLNNYKGKGRLFQKLGGRRGGQTGQFTWPRGTAVCPVNGSIVVADSGNHRIQIFDCNWQFVNQFGTFGTSATEFDGVAGVACNQRGDIIVTDRYNHRVQVFDRYGQFQYMFGREGIANGQLSYPWGVAVDMSDNIYVVDMENHRVQLFKRDGTFLRLIGGFGEDESRFQHPHYVAVGYDGKVIVSDSDNNRCQVFSPTGEHLVSFGTEGSEPGQLSNPRGVAFDRQGFILVADSGNDRVQVFRGNGQHFTSFGSFGAALGKFKGLEGIALTSDGKIIASDKENHRLQVF